MNAQNLSLSGSWTNDGVVLNNTGTITFNGAIAQTIGGATSTTFANITISNTAGGVGLSAAQTLTGTFSVTTAATFNTNGNIFTFPSDIGATARLGTIAAGATLSGTTWRFERYVAATASSTLWDDLSSPVQAPADISDWDAELKMSLALACPDKMANGFQSVYRSEERRVGKECRL